MVEIYLLMKTDRLPYLTLMIVYIAGLSTILRLSFSIS